MKKERRVKECDVSDTINFSEAKSSRLGRFAALQPRCRVTTDVEDESEK
jgi:hypothetical protein